jgi:hypothetical protein
MSEFSSWTTKLVTPLLRQRGFKKLGAFNRSSTHDLALYRRGDLQFQLTFAFHTYDYPDVGIWLQVRDVSGICFERFYPPCKGGVEAMLRAVIADINVMDWPDE